MKCATGIASRRNGHRIQTQRALPPGVTGITSGPKDAESPAVLFERHLGESRLRLLNGGLWLSETQIDHHGTEKRSQCKQRNIRD